MVGADRCGNALPPRAEHFHCRDRGFGDTGLGTAPTGMGGTDDPGLGIGKQHRRAIGGHDAKRHTRPPRHQGIDPRRSIPGPRLDHFGDVRRHGPGRP